MPTDPARPGDDDPDRTAAYPPAPDATGDYRPDDATDAYAPGPPGDPAPPSTNPGPADATGAYTPDPSRAETGAYGAGPAGANTGASDPAAGPFFRGSLDGRKARPNLDAETVGQRDLMMSLARTGSPREAVAMAEAVRVRLGKDPGALVDVACCYAVCSAGGADQGAGGRHADKALEALRQAVDAGYGDKVNLETEPDLDAVRARPEFKALVDRLPEP